MLKVFFRFSRPCRSINLRRRTIGLGFFIFAAHRAWAGQDFQISILHTNDLHSHFKAELDEANLGGLARLKTQVDRLKNDPAWRGRSVLVDAGDWSEGQIYYTLDGGASTLELMDDIGYSATILGNHDWLNGPDLFLNAAALYRNMRSLLHPSQSATSGHGIDLVATNVDVTPYENKSLWNDQVAEVSIQNLGGVRVAFVGILTIGHEYDDFLKPVLITDAVQTLAKKVKELKRSSAGQRARADLVVALSHNAIADNLDFLEKVPGLDFIVGAHDHVKLMEPKYAQRAGTPGFVVETGCWGRFLGQVVLNTHRDDQGKLTWSLAKYQLHQLDSTVPENPTIKAKVEALDRKIIQSSGETFFTKSVIRNELHLDRNGLENRMLNFATQAYLFEMNQVQFPQAPIDFAWDQTNFVYGPLFPGELHPVDFFNADPGVFSPITEKTWTLKTLKMRGSELLILLELAYGSESALKQNFFSTAGLRLVYDPILLTDSQRKAIQLNPELEEEPPSVHRFFANSKNEIVEHLRQRNYGSLFGKKLVRDIYIQDQPLVRSKMYSIVLSQGVMDSIDFVNHIANEETTGFWNTLANLGQDMIEVFTGGKLINYVELADTGVQGYEAIQDYAIHLGQWGFTLNQATVPLNAHARSAQPDLGVDTDSIEWIPSAKFKENHRATLEVTVKNYGESPSEPGAMLHLYGNEWGSDQTQPVKEHLFVNSDFPIPPIPGVGADGVIHQKVFEVINAWIPGSNHLYPIFARIKNSKGEVNLTNDRAVRFFKED